MSFDLFQVSSNDQSAFYLANIFGQVGNLLPSNAINLIGVLSNIFNTAALSLGAMIVTYTVVAGLLSTAAEGEFLGKKWHGFWVPIRTVLGIASLFPSSNGYSAIQVILMWLILQGVGLADKVWTAALNYTSQQGSATATISSQFPQETLLLVPQQFQSLFSGLVCQATQKQSQNPPNFASQNLYFNYYCDTTSSSAFCATSLPAFNTDPSISTYNMGNADNINKKPSCGTMTYCNENALCQAPNSPSSLGCILCQAQKQALSNIVSTLSLLAGNFATADNQYINFYTNSTQENLSESINNADWQWIHDYYEATTPNDQTNSATLSSNTNASTNSNNNATLFCAEAEGDDSLTTGNTPICRNNWPTIGYYSDNHSPIDYSSTSTDAMNMYLQYKLAADLTQNGNMIDPIAAAVTLYQATLSAAYLTYTTNLLESQSTNNLQGWIQTASNNGWILAGLYYYSLAKGAQQNNPINAKNIPVLNVDYPSTPPSITDSSGQPTLRDNHAVMNDLFNAMKQNAASNGSSSTNSNNSAIPASTFAGLGGNDPTAAATTTANMILSKFMNLISNGAGAVTLNPLVEIANFGFSMMRDMEITFTVTLVVVTLISGLAGLNFIVLGSGLTASVIGEIWKTLWGMLSPAFFLFMTATFSMGAIMGIYVPLIPYMIFTLGAIGWFLAVIELMVAGPIIALGILSPSGQHEILGKSEQAVMIIFNLILRPSLMIFGLLISLFLSSVIVTLINQGFSGVTTSISADSDIIEGFILIAAYTSLLVTAMNKVFSLIFVIPERVLTYIGGHAINYGESEGLQGIKQGVESTASSIGGAGKETIGAGMGASQVAMAARHGGKSEAAKANEGQTVKAEQKGGQGAETPTPPSAEAPK